MVGTAVRAVLELADSMGAAWFRDRGLALGHAARLKGLEAASTPATAEVDEPWGLSRREREVLELLVDGRSNREIGDVLFISNKTVSVHVTHIMDKLGVSRRTEAAMLALRSGIAGRSAD